MTDQREQKTFTPDTLKAAVTKALERQVSALEQQTKPSELTTDDLRQRLLSHDPGVTSPFAVMNDLTEFDTRLQADMDEKRAQTIEALDQRDEYKRQLDLADAEFKRQLRVVRGHLNGAYTRIASAELDLLVFADSLEPDPCHKDLRKIVAALCGELDPSLNRGARE